MKNQKLFKIINKDTLLGLEMLINRFSRHLPETPDLD